MMKHELNSWIYRTLAQCGTWMTFEQLAHALHKETPEWTDTICRSYLRGELGLMIRGGSVIRDPNKAQYKISDDLNLF